MKRFLNITALVVLTSGVGAFVWLRQQAERPKAMPEMPALPDRTNAAAREETLATTLRRDESVPPAIPRAVNTPAASVPNKPAPNPAMLKDPEMRALMRKQQEQAIARAADRVVSKDFARDWNLSAAQVTRLKELFADRTTAGKDLLMAMMFDGLDDEELAQRGRETKQRIDENNAALRALLGTDGYNALLEQERSLEERDRLKRLREEFALAEIPLSKPQQEALLEAMSAERQAFSFRVDLTDPAKVDFERVRDYFSEANLQMHFEDVMQLNARVAERAALFLSAEQVEKLRATQTDQVEKARLTTRVTTELFNQRRGR